MSNDTQGWRERFNAEWKGTYVYDLELFIAAELRAAIDAAFDKLAPTLTMMVNQRLDDRTLFTLEILEDAASRAKAELKRTMGLN